MWIFINSHNTSQDFTFRCLTKYQYVDTSIVDYWTYDADFHNTPDHTDCVCNSAESK